MERLHRRSSSSSAAATRSLGLQNLVFENRPQKLSEIEESLAHKLTLIDWNAQLTGFRDNLARKISSLNSSTSNLYQILGLFFVFEGVVITAAAHASAIKCSSSWLIFGLSGIATVATSAACIQKLGEIAEGNRICLEEKALCSSLHSSIERLKEDGILFDLAKGQPKLRVADTEWADQSSVSSGFWFWFRGVWKTWVWSYAGAVLLVLLAFSGVTLAAVHLIVCDPHRNS